MECEQEFTMSLVVNVDADCGGLSEVDGVLE